ncbi:Uncharacterised protein [Pseudomonas aeruginosa]|nr:Uncharacterised protein [Pseudomonas aeruginosa]
MARERGARGKALPRKGQKASRSARHQDTHMLSLFQRKRPGRYRSNATTRIRPPERVDAARVGRIAAGHPRVGRSCWSTSGSARLCRASSSPSCTARRWSATPNWFRPSRLPNRSSLRTRAGCSTMAWRSLPMPSSCGSPICFPSAQAPRTKLRRLKPGLLRSPMPRCCTTSARSPSICTSNWPMARCGTRGTVRCTSRTASATATIANTACTARRRACSTANCWTPNPGLAQ